MCADHGADIVDQCNLKAGLRANAVGNIVGILKAIAVAGLKADDSVAADCTPCGLCRQTLREFAAPDYFKVYVASSESSWREFTLAGLLPESFG